MGEVGYRDAAPAAKNTLNCLFIANVEVVWSMVEVVVVVASLVVKQGVAQAALKCIIVSISELIHSLFLHFVSIFIYQPLKTPY